MSTETIQQAIPAGSWAVDPIHSSVTFAVTHNGVSTFRSGFERYDARLAGGAAPSLEGTVEVAGIEIDEEMLKGHLLSPDFFDAERFPELRFRSTELSVDEDGGVRLLGELKIRGETREVEASGRFAEIGAGLDGAPRVGLSLAATVDRRTFGLDWQAELPAGGQALDYAVSVAVELELAAEAE
jgi:polyisoprenoid-binding protein YceI